MTGQDKFGFSLYHVYFNGLKRDETTENFLITYDGKKAPGLDYLIEHKHKGKLFMDSGAYPAFRNDTDLDIDKYIDYVNQVGDHLDAIAQLDYIPRTKDGTLEERAQKSADITWERYMYMWERVRPELRHKLIYVVHLAEDTEKLYRRALEWRDKDGVGIQYLGLALSLSNKAERLRQIAIANKVLAEYNYCGNLHIFGLQVLEMIQACPYATTSDSSSAIRDQMTGRVFVKGTIIKISADTAVHHKSDLTQAQRAEVDETLRKRAEEMGIDYERAKVDAQERFLWGCRERSAYIEGGSKQYKPVMTGNLFRRKL